MYHVSAQGADERMINVHYYYYYYYYYIGRFLKTVVIIIVISDVSLKLLLLSLLL